MYHLHEDGGNGAYADAIAGIMGSFEADDTVLWEEDTSRSKPLLETALFRRDRLA